MQIYTCKENIAKKINIIYMKKNNIIYDCKIVLNKTKNIIKKINTKE